MELWHAWVCPYCMRVRIALAEKRLPCRAPLVAKLPERLRPGALGLPRLARWEAAVTSRPSVAPHVAPRRAA